MVARSRRTRQTFDIWPGFVDALAGLLIIFLFVLMVFMTAQFFLSDMLMGRDRTIARLQSRISELARMLSLEQQESAEAQRQIEEIQRELRATLAVRDRLREQLGEAEAARQAARERIAELESRTEAQQAEIERRGSRIQAQQAELERRRQRIQEQQAELERRGQRVEQQQAELERRQERAEAQRQRLQSERQRRMTAEQQLDLLNRQIAELRAQLAAIQEALEASEATREQQELQIERLGERLNAALATQVQRLQRYRSEFFGRLREVLGDRSNISIVGDRFVFQSEVLFPSGSDALQSGGREQLTEVADTLKDIMDEIPEDIDWVLRVDGHTDIRPLRAGAEFNDNWELSAARAIAVVRFFIDQGIPADRLVAAGFGPNHPLDDRETPEAYARNRRIELKITQR